MFFSGACKVVCFIALFPSLLSPLVYRVLLKPGVYRGFWTRWIGFDGWMVSGFPICRFIFLFVYVYGTFVASEQGFRLIPFRDSKDALLTRVEHLLWHEWRIMGELCGWGRWIKNADYYLSSSLSYRLVVARGDKMNRSWKLGHSTRRNTMYWISPMCRKTSLCLVP